MRCITILIKDILTKLKQNQINQYFYLRQD